MKKYIKKTIQSLLFSFLITLTIGCASDSHIKKSMDRGAYTEVILSLGYKFTYGYKDADKYINYHLGLLVEHGYFTAMNTVAASSFEEHFKTSVSKEDMAFWGTDELMLEFYTKSANAGFSPAMLKLAKLSQGPYTKYGESKDLIYRAASYGNPAAISFLENTGVSPPELVIPQEIIITDLDKEFEINNEVANHDRELASTNKERHKQETEELISMFKKVGVGLAIVASAAIVVDNVKPDSNDSYRTRAFETGLVNGLTGAEAPNISYSNIPALTHTPLAKPTQVKAITSASAGFSMPQVVSKSNTDSYSVSTPIKAVIPNVKAQQPLRQGKCECSCVNGALQALCSSSIDIKPTCSPRVCPIVTPSVKPKRTSKLPPIGTESCDLQQVYNENRRQYEWQEVCT